MVLSQQFSERKREKMAKHERAVFVRQFHLHASVEHALVSPRAPLFRS